MIKLFIGITAFYVLNIFVGQMTTAGSPNYIRVEEDVLITKQSPASIMVDTGSVFSGNGTLLYLRGDQKLYCVVDSEAVSGGWQLDLRASDCNVRNVIPTVGGDMTRTDAVSEVTRNVGAGRDFAYTPQPINISGADIQSTPWYDPRSVAKFVALVSSAVALDFPFYNITPLNYVRYVIWAAYTVAIGMWVAPLLAQLVGGLFSRLGRLIPGGG